ncbi:MAG: phosphate/phosphite/phosphonate ABC transporter substrate-binding protein [Thermoflexales bacterium]
MNRRSFIRGAGAFAAASAAASVIGTPVFARQLSQRQNWPKKFIIGIYPDDDAAKAIAANEALRAYLEKTLDIPVELFTATSYSAIVEAIRARRIDAMEVGPFAHVLAVQEAKVEPLVVAIYPRIVRGVLRFDPQQQPYYFSVIFTKKGSGIKTVADLKGRQLAFTDPASASGHLMPKTLLFQRGLNPDKDLKTVFAGNHPAAVLAVWNDKVDAGATFEENLYLMTNNGQVDACGFADGINRTRTDTEVRLRYNACKEGQLVIVAFTPPIPNTPFAVRPGLPQSFKQAVRTALLDIRNNPELLNKHQRYYDDPTDRLKLKKLDDFYNVLRAAARFLKLDLTKLR